jgi:iron complex outermembrane recepter protein
MHGARSMTRHRLRWRLGSAIPLLVGVALPHVARAHAISAVAPHAVRDDDPPCVQSVPSRNRSAQWGAPLDRLVTLRTELLPLREVLDALATAAGIQLSYSADLFAAQRPVCLQVSAAPLGAILDQLLVGSGVRPIVVGSTAVVLAPERHTAVSPDEAPVTRRASMLDRVVVTGSPDGAALRGSPHAVAIIDGTTLTQHGVQSLGDALDLASPGIWTWTPGAGMVSARFGSIRGASSFGVSAPKVYLDGIEVANPLLVTQLDPQRVARVEVIRGPQGAALYGADAISGVVNIVSRHDGTPDGRPTFHLSTSAGVTSTLFVDRAPLVQQHGLSFRTGSASRSLGLGVSGGSSGAFVPGAAERRLLADADGRLVRGQTILTGIARFAFQEADAGTAFGGDVLPLPTAVDSALGQRVAQYTVGGMAMVMPTAQWTHTLIAGLDGYRLDGLSPAALQGPVSLAVAAQAGTSESAADRFTLRARSVGRFDVAEQLLLTTTVAAEQSLTQEQRPAAPSLAPPGGPGAGGALAPLRRPQDRRVPVSSYANTGGSVQLQLAWRDRWFGSVGARVERTTGATPNTQQTLLPMIGAAHVRDLGNVVVKLRGAYGTGIRPARTITRNSLLLAPVGATALGALDAERQSGVELGVDVDVGARLSLHATRFDQRASGLVQPVSSVVAQTDGAGRVARRMQYTLQNVGAIDNRGWELDARSRWGGLTVTSTLTVVESHVARLASGYRGDLQVGDRTLDIPRHTLGLSAAYASGRWLLTTSAMRAGPWIGYDRERIGTTLASAELTPRDLEGSNLRSYWLTYPGVTRWRGSVSYRVRGDVHLLAGGENLLDVQRGAPDNASVIAGRTMSLGVRATF